MTVSTCCTSADTLASARSSVGDTREPPQGACLSYSRSPEVKLPCVTVPPQPPELEPPPSPMSSVSAESLRLRSNRIAAVPPLCSHSSPSLQSHESCWVDTKLKCKGSGHLFAALPGSWLLGKRSAGRSAGVPERLRKAAQRPAYEVAQRNGSILKGAMADMFEDFTFWHVEPVEVMLRVGYLGCMRSLLTVGMLVFILHRAVTTNVFLEEVTPGGHTTLWERQDDKFVLETIAQQVHGPFCGYNRSYDYVYEEDSDWEYTGSACASVPLAAMTFKGAHSLHVVTYEQRHETFALLADIASCETVCSIVYAEWPNASTYGNRSWIAASVMTALRTDMATRNHTVRSEISDAAANNVSREPVLNLRLARPRRDSDGHCSCHSVENVMLLGVEAISIQFDHMYDAGFQHGSSKGSGPTDPIGFIMARGGSSPFKVIPRGGDSSFTVEEALTALGMCLDCLPDPSKQPMRWNALCSKDRCQAPYNGLPFLRTSGMSVDIRTEYYTHKVVMPEEKGYQWIRDRYEPPYAITVLWAKVQWNSRGYERGFIDTRETVSLSRQSYRYGLLFRIQPPGGKVCRQSYEVIVSSIVNFTVLLAMPAMVVSFVIFYAYGRRSQTFRHMQRKTFSLTRLYDAFTCNALMADLVFQELDPEQRGVLERPVLSALFGGMVMPTLRARWPSQPQAWYQEMLDRLLDMLCFPFKLAGDNGEDAPLISGVSQEEFVSLATRGCGVTLDDLVAKMEDPRVDDGADAIPKRIYRT